MKGESTTKLAEFVENTKLQDVPQEVVSKAKILVADFLGVAVAGSRSVEAQIIQGFIREVAGSGDATLVGSGIRSHPIWASFYNGVAGHALDFDDVSHAVYGHPTVAVLPAAIALSEHLNADGGKLLESYILGVEVMAKLGYYMNPEHYRRGWHSTCTLGSIGATVASAKLLGLKGKTLRSALALACSQAGGLQQNFGTMTKPFHAGKAAQNGVLAAILAARGWTGDQNILEAPLGFFRVFSDPEKNVESALEKLGSPFEIDSPGLILKRYPSCAFSHAIIDAALEISLDPTFEVQEVERVEGIIHSLADQILIHKTPKTGLEAKFSMEACLAFALVDKKVTVSSFRDEQLNRPEVRKIMSKIQRRVVLPTSNGPPQFGPATVVVWLRDGRKLEATVTKPKGDPERPLTVDEIKEKYMDCCADVVESRDREESWALLERLENAPRVKDLMRYFTVTL